MHSDDDNAVTTDEKVWDLTMDINLKAVFFCCKYGIPLMKGTGNASIVNVASFVGLRGAATPQIAYTASKGGVLALSRELAIIHAKEGIRVQLLHIKALKNLYIKIISINVIFLKYSTKLIVT